ncbi:sulfurtransferase [Enterovibrio sp. ZSDZ42]|uniref:Sulfurtransferase n=1 Tax=Enterovibrio gelatinilyticus TaxID=2899819 RepID=A0ABT5QVY6_9GAMM|nr:sulfurtransferase [Enterovibrio sp. ZSDZ42]MDD1792181.1 sulfurtransferase [Enterovibrio sp. ZSDZ42]
MLASKESDLQQVISALVSAEWLRDNLNIPNLKMIDASWFMPGSERNAKSEWMSQRIPGAVYFDFDAEIVDKSSSLPHMLPSPAQFEQAVSALGIDNEDIVVAYDSSGIFSAPRVWWMFKAMGHQSVAVLDGGFPAWISAGGEIDSELPRIPAKTQYVAELVFERVIDKDTLLAGISSASLNVIDVRPADRFAGSVPEPRAGVRSGHMPNAKNLPFGKLLVNGKFKDKSELERLITPVVSADMLNVSSCGSGVTACILSLASEITLGKPITVYDGSWSEWGSDSTLPIVSD